MCLKSASNFILANQRYYYLSNQNSPYPVAKNYCESVGAQLAVISDVGSETSVYNFRSKTLAASLEADAFEIFK